MLDLVKTEVHNAAWCGSRRKTKKKIADDRVGRKDISSPQDLYNEFLRLTMPSPTNINLPGPGPPVASAL